jgi:hypothetical protein
MEEDFILIGWAGRYNSPIIAPKNINWLHNKTGIPFDTGLASYFRDMSSVSGRLFIILSQLYKLPNIRNLDLYSDLLQVANTLLIDTNFNIILKGIGYTSSDKSSKDKYYEFHKESILDIERTYPGLIKRIYLKDEPVIMGPSETPYGERIMGPSETPYGGKKYTKKNYNKNKKLNTTKNNKKYKSK